jgi:hypothetical protein
VFESVYAKMPETDNPGPNAAHKIKRKPLGSPHPSDEIWLRSSHGRNSFLAVANRLEESDYVPLIPLQRLNSLYTNEEEPPVRPYNSSNKTRSGNPWRPGFWLHFPTLGIAALLVVLACK